MSPLCGGTVLAGLIQLPEEEVAMRRHELTDHEWAVIEPLLP
jgi:hypothetical protein